MYDTIIIGGGPAGISAGLTLRARNKDVLIITAGKEASPLYKAESINNYLGLPGVSGPEMLELFVSQAISAGIYFAQGRAQKILPFGKVFSVSVGDNIYESKSIIIATGVSRNGQIKGERELLGRGVSYCATCDGMLYRGKTVVLSGEGEEAEEDARFLMEICKSVIRFSGKGNERIVSINGEMKVSSVTTETENIECDGVFIAGGNIPAESLIYGIETLDGFIVTDKSMKTNIPGVFAAGDCTGKPFQIAKAAGEGLVAALSAVAYI